MAQDFGYLYVVLCVMVAAAGVLAYAFIDTRRKMTTPGRKIRGEKLA